MKKTIAILLILVIGMVGVFADDPSTQIKLKTTIDEYTRMAITNNSSPQFTGTVGEDGSGGLLEVSSVYSDSAYEFGNTSIYLHAESNRRIGATISMQAQPLTAPLEGQGQDAYTPYLDYKITISSPGADETSIDVVSKTTEGVIEDAVKVVELRYNTTARTPDSYKGTVVIVITDDTTEAAAGTYEGSVTFTVTAD